MSHGLPQYKLRFIVDDRIEKHGSVGIAFYDQSGGQNYMRIESTPLVSIEDAAFLYREKRIEKFIVFDPSEDEKEMIGKKVMQIGIRNNDLLIIAKKT